MAKEDVLIFEVKTGEAVKSVNDLRENIKILKDAIGSLDAGSEEYQTTLAQLKINQSALRDAMKGSTEAMEGIDKVSRTATKSYATLVQEMSRLKAELRNTDISTEEGMNAFRKLAGEIDSVNTELKQLDAMQGNYQRNVGNYTGGIEDFFSKFEMGGLAIQGMINPIKNVTTGFKALSATPVVGILSLLAGVIAKVVGELETSEQNANRLTIALAPLNSASTALTRVMQFLGDKLAWVAEKFTGLLEKMGLVDETMKEHQNIAKEEIALNERRREVEMANADAMLEVAQLRAKTAEKDKYTAQERIAFIEEAAQKEREIADRNVEIARREYEVLKRKSELAGNSKEENDALADAYVRVQGAETEYFNKTRELSAQRVEAINQIKAETKATQELKVAKDALNEGRALAYEGENDEVVEDSYYAELEAQAERGKAIIEGGLEVLGAKEQQAMREMEIAQKVAEFEKQMEEEKRAAFEETQRMRLATIMEAANATSTILSAIADMYENDSKEDRKSAEKAKALRISSAIIDTISGAIGAYMQSVKSIPPPFGQITGAIQAAAITATGMAQVQKIRSTQVGGSTSSSAGAFVAPPSVDTNLPTIRNLISASEEDRLNRAAQPQRVYILQSDIEASARQSRVQVAEASF